MEPLSVYETLQAHLRQPEYLHALLHPLPVYGVAFGILALVLAFWLKNRAAHVVALSLLLISGLSAWPVKEFGEKAYDRIEAMSDKQGYAWLDAHAQRAVKTVPVFYVLAAAAALALVIPLKIPKLGKPLSVMTLLVALAAMAIGGWIAYAGGKIRHKEFRLGPPPERPGKYEKERD